MSNNTLTWNEDALKRLGNVPFFVRPMAKSKIEKAALERGLDTITVELMDEIKKKEMG